MLASVGASQAPAGREAGGGARGGATRWGRGLPLRLTRTGQISKGRNLCWGGAGAAGGRDLRLGCV